MRPLATTFSRSQAARGATLLLAATLAGCGLFRRGEPQATTLSDDAEAVSTRPVSSQEVQTFTGAVPGVLQPMNRPIVQGPLPLVYLTESAGTLRITNVQTGEEIAVVDVKENQILRVATKGVVLASETVLGATLAQGNYAITPLSTDAGIIRSEQVRIRPTVPAEAPTSQPAAETPPAPTADTPPPAN